MSKTSSLKEVTEGTRLPLHMFINSGRGLTVQKVEKTPPNSASAGEGHKTQHNINILGTMNMHDS